MTSQVMETGMLAVAGSAQGSEFKTDIFVDAAGYSWNNLACYLND